MTATGAHLQWEALQQPDFPLASCKDIPDLPWVSTEDCRRRPSAFEMQQMRMICDECHERISCAMFAITHRELRGFWGGMTDRERIRLRTGLKETK